LTQSGRRPSICCSMGPQHGAQQQMRAVPCLRLNTGLLIIIYCPHTHTHTHTHTHPFNGPLSETTRVSRYQIGETNLDFTEARDSEWQWHQLGRMQVCTSLQTDDHASTPPLSFFTGRMPFLPPNQQCQSTEGDYCPPYDLFTTQSVVTNSGQNTTVLQRREAHKDA